jgi:hypothetical protein
MRIAAHGVPCGGEVGIVARASIKMLSRLTAIKRYIDPRFKDFFQRIPISGIYLRNYLFCTRLVLGSKLFRAWAQLPPIRRPLLMPLLAQAHSPVLIQELHLELVRSQATDCDPLNPKISRPITLPIANFAISFSS